MKPGIRLLLDLGPLVIFFYVNGQYGIWIATGLFMVLAVIGLGIHWFVERKLPVMPLLSTALVLVFGGLTLYLADEIFIKLKPTILYLMFATILGVGLWRGQLWVSHLFGGTIDLPDFAWRILTYRLISLLLVEAALNEIIWRTQTTEFWIASKFGIMVLGLVFMMAQTPFLMRHDRTKRTEGEDPTH
jgi:intracellular septation protein